MSCLNIYLLRVQLGSIIDRIYKVGDEFLNRGINKLSSTILGVEVQY